MSDTLRALLAVPGLTFDATVTSVTDGDTIRATVHLGQLEIAGLTCDVTLGNPKGMSIRLAGCNAWELSTPAGKAARDNLRTILRPGDAVTLSNVTPYKYGLEVVADVALGDGSDLVSLLTAGFWVAAWDGTGARPLPPWPRPASQDAATP